MSDLARVAEMAVTAAREQKEQRAGRRDTELPTTLLAYRGHELVALVSPDRIDRDQMLAAAHAVAVGFGPDILAMAFETFHTSLEANPVTGQRWGQREMQDVAEHHDGRAKGWVEDAITVLAYNRAGDATTRVLCYRMEAKTVVWNEHAAPEHPTFGGLVHESLVAIMRATPLDVIVARSGYSGGADFGLDAEETRAHMDCAVVRTVMSALGCTVVLPCEPGSVRARIIQMSIPGAEAI